MSVTVYITKGGLKYHSTKHCVLLTSAQALNDVDCCDGDICFCRGPFRQIHAIEPVSHYDALQHRLPCLNCVPQNLRKFTVRDFGHHPVMGFADPLGRGLGLVCSRCRTIKTGCSLDAFEMPMRWMRFHSVRWPCTSAIVLGLVSRGRT